jgi:predicted RNase H-like HicB family nuclease
MIIYKMNNDDGLDFVAEYPALKGVSGVGSSPQEAIDSLIESAEFNIEGLKEAGLPIPLEDAYIEDDYSGKITLRLSKGLHRKVAEIANNQGISLNQYLLEAISAYSSTQVMETEFVNKTFEFILNVTSSSYSSFDFFKQPKTQIEENSVSKTNLFPLEQEFNHGKYTC